MTSEMKRPPRAKRIPSLVRAEHLLAAGDSRGAIAVARAILKKDRHQIGALEVLAKSEWQVGEYQSLLITLEKLIRLNPYEPGYFALRGAVYQALGRVGEAVAAFARAGNDHNTSGASVEALRNFQATIIAQMLGEDPVFKAQYAQDAEKACPERGFEFVPEYRVGENWLATIQAQHAAAVRPS